MALKGLLAHYGQSRRLPDIAGKYSGGLVICGDAAGVWDDLEAFGCRCDDGKGSVKKDGWDFLTINKLIETFPGHVEHCYSNEPHLLHKFMMARRNEYAKEFNLKPNIHSCNDGAQWVWPWGGHGTSGLGATVVGVGLGYKRIVFCGVPLDDGPHNGEPPWRRTKFASSEATDHKGGPDEHWQRAIQAFRGKVFSMSGRTREWFGCPT